jgi:hypothetical protein
MLACEFMSKQIKFESGEKTTSIRVDLFPCRW